jgi:gliding motility-associated-like protein
LILFASEFAFAQSPVRDQKVPTLLEQFKLPKRSTDSKINRIPIAGARPFSPHQVTSSCNTWTFQMKLGDPGVSERVNDMVQLSTSDYIMVGTANFGSGEQGLVAKFGAQGTVLASNIYSLAGYTVSFKKIKQFSDAKIYFVCDITQTASGTTWPALGSMDSNLNILWLNKIDVSGLPGSWNAVDLAESDIYPNDFSFVISNGLQYNVTRYSTQSSSIVWSKTYQSRGNLEVTGMSQYYYNTTIAYNDTDSGFRRGVVVNVNDSNGNVIKSSSIGGIDGYDYYFQSYQLINYRPRITGYQRKNGVYEFIKQNYTPDGLAQLKETFSVNGLNLSNGINSAEAEFTEKLGFTDAASPTDLYVVSTFPENYHDPISAKRFSYTYPVTIRRLVHTLDGGVLIASNTEDAALDIAFTKVDSSTYLDGCPTSFPVPASFTPSVTQYNTPTIPVLNNGISFSPISLVQQPHSMQGSYDCQSNYCPTVAEPDTCLKSFFKEYRNPSDCMGFSQVIKTTNGKIMVAGGGRQNPYKAEDDTYLTLFDTLGKIVDPRVIELPGREGLLGISEVIKLKDGNNLAVGSLYEENFLAQTFVSELVLIKFDDQFNLIWSKRMLPNYDLGEIGRVLESSEGDLYCWLSTTPSTPLQKTYLLKLNSAATPVWFKRYDAGPDIFLGDNYGEGNIQELGNYIYLQYREDENSDWGPRMLKLNKSDGSVVWAKKIPFAASTYHSAPTVMSFLTDKQNLFLFGKIATNGNFFMKLSPDGDIISSKQIGNPFLTLLSANRATDSTFILGVNRYIYPDVIYGAVQMDTSFATRNSQFVRIPKTGGNGDIMAYSDSVAYGVGLFFYNNAYWSSAFLQKFSFNGSFGSCEVTNLPLDLVDYPVSSIPFSNQAENLSLPTVNTLNVQLNPYTIGYAGYFCGKTACNLIKLTGPTTICDTVNTYDFHVTKNPDCNAHTNWIIDSAVNQVKVILSNDTLLRVKIRYSGIIKIKSQIFASCDFIEDSLLVTAASSIQSLNLGPDSVICPGNSIKLNAHAGFTSYKWQDGSTDSIYIATQPGMYYVEVVAGCTGATLRDTVNISPHAPIPLSIGPDRSKCNNDTLHLDAPPGFINYTWSPAYNISSTTGMSVVVNPLTDTSYFLKAEKTPGCFAFDTVAIKTYQSPPINLGPDVSFCKNDSVVFNAGIGFSTYAWNTGNVNQYQVAKVIGVYSVVATTVEGCKSFDTANVQIVYQIPIVNLDKSSSLCEGTTRTLDAGAGFNSYVWDDGSSSRFRSVFNTGTYFVNVQDVHGCRGGDTTTINTINPLPKGFLPADTSICSYGKLELIPTGSYDSYLWNNNANSKSITINKPGLYWLKVTDAKKCTGGDSILVTQKDCMVGFYVPNAFSPKRNGYNDVFRPLLFGVVKKYEFTIYNRWGQMIYHSTTLGEGWDGTLSGKTQDAGTYVWMCTYQLEGEKVKVEKGAVVLIR